MKKIVPKIMALAVVVATLATCLAGCNPVTTKQDPVKNASYVNLDINPNIDLVVDTNNRVISVVANNDDAEKLLINAKVLGKTVDDAVETIIGLSFEMGYITTENDDVKVIAVNAKGEINEKLVDKIVSDVNAAADKAQAAIEEGKRVVVKVIDDVTNSLNARLEAFKENVKADASVDEETKTAVANLTVGKFLLAETVVTMSNGTITMETAVTMDMTKLNRYLYELNQKCEVVVEGIVAELEAAAIEIQKEAQAALNEVYKQIDNAGVMALWTAKNAYVGAQNLLSDVVVAANDVIQDVKEYTKNAPTTERGQADLNKKVEEYADRLYSDDEESLAKKQAFLDSMKVDGRYTYASVAVGFDNFYDNCTEEELTEYGEALGEFYLWFDMVHQDVYEEVYELVQMHFNGAMKGMTTAVNGYVYATNVMNKHLGLPEIAAPETKFANLNEMVEYVTNMISTQNANVEKAFAEFVENELNDEQKALVEKHNQMIKDAYEEAKKQYEDSFNKVA